MYSDFDKENLQPEEQGERKCHNCGLTSEGFFCSTECRKEYEQDYEQD